MSALGLKFPDFSGHPPPPQLNFEEYECWIFEQIIPMLAERGEMTEEKLLADFMNNEGRVKEWPDFGAAHDDPPAK
jgi:hypothetical protein